MPTAIREGTIATLLASSELLLVLRHFLDSREGLMEKQLFAFVLMPFDKVFDDVYKFGIKETVEAAGMLAERVDEQIFHSEKILERIYNQIEVADFIIADMSGRNPNVFYEVGYAHAKGKSCILLTSSASDIAFDLTHHRHIVYGKSIRTLKSALSSDLAAISKEVAEKANPISVALHSARGDLEKSKWLATGILDLHFDLNNESERASPEIDVIYFYTGSGWTFSQNKSECPSSESDVTKHKVRHLIRAPVRRLQKGAWDRVAITGRKKLATAFKGEKLEDKYRVRGLAMLRVVTTAGSYDFPTNIDVECEEFPF